MKADRHGTHTERQRHLAGWITPTARKGSPDTGSCKTCGFFESLSEGRFERCAMHGFSTRKGARCSHYIATRPA